MSVATHHQGGRKKVRLRMRLRAASFLCGAAWLAGLGVARGAPAGTGAPGSPPPPLVKVGACLNVGNEYVTGEQI